MRRDCLSQSKEASLELDDLPFSPETLHLCNQSPMIKLASSVAARLVGLLITACLVAAADRGKSIDFAGWVTAVDPRARTIEVKGKKIFVFTVDPKCRVARGGNWWNQPGADLGTLNTLKVGDAVIGKLSLAGAQPRVVSLEATPNPEPGVPLPKKPGFIISPIPPAAGSRLTFAACRAEPCSKIRRPVRLSSCRSNGAGGTRARRRFRTGSRLLRATMRGRAESEVPSSLLQSNERQSVSTYTCAKWVIDRGIAGTRQATWAPDENPPG